MKSVLNWISGIILVAAVGFGLLAIGNGKVVTVFGEEIFMASPNDMATIFVMLLLAAPATIWILFALYERGQKLEYYRNTLSQWEIWFKSNQGKTIPRDGEDAIDRFGFGNITRGLDTRGLDKP